MHLNFDYSKALNFFNEQEVKNGRLCKSSS